MRNLMSKKWMHSVVILSNVLLLIMLSGCAQLRLPAIDPLGRDVFLPAPNSTGLLTSGNPAINPLRPGQPNNPVFQPPSFSGNQPPTPRFPVQPAFQPPAVPPPCDGTAVQNTSRKYLIPDPLGAKSPGQNGQIILTPSRIVAPVNSEVVVLAGICGGDGYFVKNQPLEWMLSNNSAGEFVEVGGGHHKSFNKLIPPTSKKFSGTYAWGRTGLKNIVLSRGTPTPVDDIELRQGQTFVSVASASPGTSYVTAVAPKAEGWDKRRATTIIHWVDGLWSIPTPARATAGTVFPLTTVVNRTAGGGLKGWEVRYQIVGGAPAEFAPTGSQKADATTDSDGKATVQLRQPAGQFDPGTTQIRVDIVRPPVFGEQELVVESGITSVTWSAPALTIRAVGPKQAEFDTPFNYRISVTNPGDQVAKDVVVRTKNLADGIEFISSTPKPTEYGRDYEWKIGDVAPGATAKIIDVQLKSQKRGNVGMCFEVISESDGLQTEACTETEVVVPCIGFDISGPTRAKVGDQASFNLTVSNRCDEPLENIRVRVAYDPGLVRPNSANPAVFEYPQLSFGESRTLPITFDVQGLGPQCFVVEISADNVRTQTARRCVDVTRADGAGSSDSPNPGASPLVVTLAGAAPTEVGGTSEVVARVTNRGATPINDVTLINRFSPSIEPTDMTRTFEHRWVGDELWVPLGRIEPGQTIPVTVVFEGRQVDPNAKAEFSVSTPLGASSSDSIGIRVNPASGSGNTPDFGNGGIGIPGDAGAGLSPNNGQGNLDVRVQAIDPNIQIGKLARFEVSVTNNFATPIRDVDVTIFVPNTLELYDWNSEQTNLQLEFNDKPFYRVMRALEVRPGETLTWIATVEGRAAGQATFEAQAKSVDVVGASTGSDSIVVQ